MAKTLPPNGYAPFDGVPMFRFQRFLQAAILALAAFSGSAQANCFGMNLLDIMPAAERAALKAVADKVPFAAGNHWTAIRDGARMTIIGTYHLEDPRHTPVVTAAAPLIKGAAALLVEAGPEEERALKDHMGRNPDVIVITQGPTLFQTLPKETWDRLSTAMADRGIPAFMAAKFKPWYVTVMLSMPPCALSQMADKPFGLDQQLIEVAEAADVPIKALEPFETLFTLFDTLTPQEQVEMIEQSLALEPSINDFSVTLADAYFDQQSRLMWELMRHESYAMPGYTRERVDAEMARMEDVLMVQRNRAWIPVIEAAAKEGPLVVAFGALHLSGEDGVLNLLVKAGWTIEPLALP